MKKIFACFMLVSLVSLAAGARGYTPSDPRDHWDFPRDPVSQAELLKSKVENFVMNMAGVVSLSTEYRGLRDGREIAIETLVIGASTHAAALALKVLFPEDTFVNGVPVAVEYEGPIEAVWPR